MARKLPKNYTENGDKVDLEKLINVSRILCLQITKWILKMYLFWAKNHELFQKKK
jgi:hypothetical protein